MNRITCRLLIFIAFFAFVFTDVEAVNEGKVGTPKGTFGVSGKGAATYQLMFDAPYGGKLMPKIGIAYNSQSGGGIVGYGCDITGVSVITRGRKNLFYDKKTCGVTYKADDAYYLDGTRLMLQSGEAGTDGAVYSPEGNPYTKVVVHGNCGTTDSWFEVVGTDGVTHRFGSGENSRLEYTSRSGENRVEAWYVDYSSNQYGDYIAYQYATSNFYVRPECVTYGKNSLKSRNITNRIQFYYTDLGATPVTFSIGDRQGKITLRLMRVSAFTDSRVYRHYGFIYDITGDKGHAKYARLVQIDEMNEKNEKLAPVKFAWNNLPSSDIAVKRLNVKTDDESEYIKADTKDFFAVDVNNDGISDVFRVSKVTIGSGATTYEDNILYANISRKSVDGTVSYATYKKSLGTSSVFESAKFILGGLSVLDIDGDGYNDIVFPEYRGYDKKKDLCYHVLLGNEMAKGIMELQTLVTPLVAADNLPLATYFDTEGDGKDNLVCLEQNRKDAFYTASVQQIDGRVDSYKFTLAHTPMKIFNADFNSDGLLDLLVIYNGGYKVFFNNGGEYGSPKFSDANSVVGTNLGNCYRMLPGDFDGDGRTDFLYYDSGHDFNIAFNNGDGTFTLKEQAFSLNDIIKDTRNDNDRFTILLNDIDRDGKTDILISKAKYEYERYSKKTYVKWLFYDGNNFSVAKEIITDKKDDAKSGCLFVGDFDGDGAFEIANYGSNLYDESDRQTDVIRVYTVDGNMSQLGKLASITDGFGNTTSIKYMSASDVRVYKNEKYNRWYTKHLTLPISLVSGVSRSNGSAGVQTLQYTYGGLKVNTCGKGLLGFTTMTIENMTLQTKEETVLADWDEDRTWLPLTKTVTRTVGDESSVAVAKTAVASVGNNYFAYTSEQDVTDLDGNKLHVATSYDTEKGVPAEETSSTENGAMYKKVRYMGYVQKSNMWMPTMMERIQKHKDDRNPFVSKTVYTYDDKGNVLSCIENYGTPLSLSTVCTYDVYGNVLTSEKSGIGVGKNVETNVYDASGRFVVKATESATSSVNTFAYDVWGNVTSENDETVPNAILTTTHVYDDWGTETSVTDALGNVSTMQTGWGTEKEKKYYVMQSPANKPWTRTWYDEAGNETLVESVGLNDVSISKRTHYNNNGQVESVVSGIGLLLRSDNYTYDARGRILTSSSTSGKSTTYSYDNRTVKSLTDGKAYTRTTDAWGNVVKATDPESETVYTYSSNGKPVEILAGDVSTKMQYDAVGNRTRLDDPDAGITTYTYAADGKVLTQTDARGVKTVNNYDNAGRLVSSVIGKTTITHLFGEEGYGKNRLVKSACGNNNLDFVYDRYGRVITETRHMDTGDEVVFKYAYNSKNQLESKTYPGNLVVAYSYDAYGNHIQTDACGKTLYKLESYDGMANVSSSMNRFTTTTKLNNKGFVNEVLLSDGTDKLESLNLSYDAKTGNLLSRQRNGNLAENFSYDSIDRLTGVTSDEQSEKVFSYDKKGNLTYKTGIGKCYYNIDGLPHALSSVEDSAKIMPTTGYELNYNDINRIDNIIRHNGDMLRMSFSYGPDCQRWSSVITNGMQRFGTVYAGDYEKTVAGRSAIREFFYIGDNVIIERRNGSDFVPYIVFTDNLGSILSAYDENGNNVFDADYDVWGDQSLRSNRIGLRRGYCGHEMISEFNLVNMNGRLYDPTTSRFLSPDNYVQLPENSQSYNRYSYCLNNPLKYTDPSGELFGLDDALVLGIASGAFFGAMDACMNGNNMIKGALVGATRGFASYGIGETFGHGVGLFGKEMLRAGSHGLASGVISAIDGHNFVSAFISGAAVSGIGSYAQNVNIAPRLMVASTTIMGGMVAWMTGGSFMQGAIQGMMIGALNHAQHDQYDPTGNREVLKAREIYRIKHDSEYRQKIISDIEKDGILTFEEAYYWYVYGDGSTIHVDASKLNLGRIDITDKKIGDRWNVQTLTLSGNYGVGLVYGNITVEYKGYNKLFILPDEYNFDFHIENITEWKTIKRNIETIGAAILHGIGTSFKIQFNGFYYNK